MLEKCECDEISRLEKTIKKQNTKYVDSDSSCSSSSLSSEISIKSKLKVSKKQSGVSRASSSSSRHSTGTVKGIVKKMGLLGKSNASIGKWPKVVRKLDRINKR